MKKFQIILSSLVFTAGISVSIHAEDNFEDDLTGPLEILYGQQLSRGTFFRTGYDFIVCRGANFQNLPPDVPEFMEGKSAGVFNNGIIDELIQSGGDSEKISAVEKKMKSAAEKDPQFLAFIYNYARILQIQNRHEEAFEYFKRAAAMLPELSASHANAGISLARTDRRYSAVFFLKNALKINPRDTRAELALAAFYLNEKSFAKAEYYYKHLLERYPDMPDAAAGLAAVYFKKSDLKNARKYYDSIEIEDEIRTPLPYSPVIFHERSVFYHHIGEYEKSIEDLKFLLLSRSTLFLYGINAAELEKFVKKQEKKISKRQLPG